MRSYSWPGPVGLASFSALETGTMPLCHAVAGRQPGFCRRRRRDHGRRFAPRLWRAGTQ